MQRMQNFSLLVTGKNIETTCKTFLLHTQRSIKQ